MSKIMVAKGDIHTIHHAGKVYQRGKNNTFEVDDAHVDALRPHGLQLKDEAEAAAKAKAAAKSKDDEIAALKARIAELEDKKGKKGE